jgi:signal transduction histidine kinase
LVSTDENQLVILGSPWITELKLLENLNLTMRDFPMHSPISYFLMLVQAQRISLEDSKRFSDELAQLNKDLEARVERRTQALVNQTAELLESRNKLEHEMCERQRVEVELRHAQKMEAVGQMAAGIAHEINTPIQFIGDSLKFLDEAFNDLKSVAIASEKCLAIIGKLPKAQKIHDALNRTLEDADIEYLGERVPKALERAKNGVERVSTIVGAMKEFSHPDQREMTIADINKAIESTLTVAANEYKYSATIHKEFGELPEISCHIGNINQVLLNLIVNAAHAVVDQHGISIENGKITIKTWQEGADVIISVADNGCGIPELVKDRVFDPFFTTKEVGKGTGQGLSISHKIVVENHGGQLYFETEEDIGTTFFIQLPIEPRIHSSNSAGSPLTATRDKAA